MFTDISTSARRTFRGAIQLKLVISGVTPFLLTIPALAQVSQPYHYNYGNERVVIQSQTGLYHPSSTYIGPGTMSKSAQGYQEGGKQANPGLPVVNHGSFIGTPGDNLYSDNPIRSVEQKKAAPGQPMRVIYVQAPRQQQQVRERPGYNYVPGQNNGAAEYTGGADAPVQYDRNGAATYGEGSAGGQSLPVPRRY